MTHRPPGSRHLLLFALAFGVGCSESTPPPDPEENPSAIAASAGDAQSAAAGAALPASLQVTVTGASGSGLAGVDVTWSVTAGGGSVADGTSTTNTAGVASTTWTLGVVAGAAQTVRATVGSLTVDFTAVAEAGPIDDVTLSAGNTQVGIVGEALTDSIVVEVVDAFDNPIVGRFVVWSATGGGSVSPDSSATNAMGLAAAEWSLGSATDSMYQARATIEGLEVLFDATAQAGPAAMIGALEGDAQSGVVGAPLGDSLVARVSDSFGNPVSGATVTWSVTAGSGSVSPGMATTGADGLAHAEWTLGTTAGAAQSLTASTGSTNAQFSATAEAGPAVTIEIVSGDDQLGAPSMALDDSLVVRLEDQYGNVVPGASTGWAVLAGNGSVSSSTTTTDASGLTSVTWTLGPTAGFDHVLAASIPSVAQVTFDAEAAPFDAWQVLPDMPLAVRAPAVATDGERIFVLGGTNSSGARTDTLQIFDPADHSWSAGASLPDEVDWASAVGVDGEIHLVGGVTNSVAATNEYWIYDPDLDQWRQGPNVGAPLAGAAIAATGGNIYVMGGIDGPGSRSANAHVFDLGLAQWDTLPSLPSERINWAGSAMGTDVLAAGGELNGSAVTDHLVSFTPGASMWVRLLPDMSSAREAHGAAVLDTRFCVVGGRSGATTFSSGECYQSGSGWTATPALPAARSELGAVSVGGFIYAVAGRNSSNDPVASITRLRFQ